MALLLYGFGADHVMLSPHNLIAAKHLYFVPKVSHEKPNVSLPDAAILGTERFEYNNVTRSRMSSLATEAPERSRTRAVSRNIAAGTLVTPIHKRGTPRSIVETIRISPRLPKEPYN
jgi:hypothetical protein